MLSFKMLLVQPPSRSEQQQALPEDTPLAVRCASSNRRCCPSIGWKRTLGENHLVAAVNKGPDSRELKPTHGFLLQAAPTTALSLLRDGAACSRREHGLLQWV